MILADVMDQVADRIDTIDGLVTHAFPADNVHPPAAVVTYPLEYELDATYQRGADRMSLPVVVLIGRADAQSSRDLVSAYVSGSGPRSLKAVLENDLPAGGLDLPGTAGSFASTPDHASLDITGDIDIRVELIDLTPPELSRSYLSKWSAAPNLSYLMRATLFGTFDGIWSSTGSNTLSDFTFPPALSGCFRFRLDVNNGAGGRTVELAHATNIDGPFTVLKAEPVAGTTAIASGSAPVILGGHGSGGTSNPMTGRITRARIYADRTETDLRADPDFRFQPPDTTSVVDSTGKVWTVAGSAVITPGEQFAYTAFDSLRVANIEFDVVSVARVEYLAATFTLDIFGPGA